MKEHQSATTRGEAEKSAIVEHTWAEQHHPVWDQTTVIQQAKSVDILQIKVAFCIIMAGKGKLLNRDVQPSHAFESHLYSKECFTPPNHIHHQQNPAVMNMISIQNPELQ